MTTPRAGRPEVRGKLYTTVYALVEVLLEPFAPGEERLEEDRIDRVATFVDRQRSRMSLHLRLPVTALTLLFQAAALARHGDLFHRLSAERRHRLVERWRDAKAEPLRGFVDFHARLAFFGYIADEFD